MIVNATSRRTIYSAHRLTYRGRVPAAVPKSRSPMLAVFLSGIFPGLGQLYNRDWRKAVLFSVGGLLSGFGPLSPLSIDIDPGDPATGLLQVLLESLPFMVVALWSVIDAYRSARRPIASA